MFLSRNVFQSGVRFKLVAFNSKHCRLLSTANGKTPKVTQLSKAEFDVSRFPLERCRNFSIIAHIDHGKSTLSDRLLELTGTIKKEVDQFLDNLQVERERGITVKAQTCSLVWNYKGEDYLLNLIDTPGHVDFCYEVHRSLSVCEGAILLVDANSGIQAQTIAHFNHALLSDMTILPAINKIDLKNANIELVEGQMKKLFDCDKDEILKMSAKTGIGVEDCLNAIIERIPPPKADIVPVQSSNQPLTKHLKAVVFDLWYEKFKGIILLCRVMEGCIQVGSQVVASTNVSKVHTIKELNIMHPKQVPISGNPPTLYAGQVGVVVANIHDNEDISVGDVLCFNDEEGVRLLKEESKTKMLKANPMVYASIYPCDKSDFSNLQKSLQKLLLNDSSVHTQKEIHPALGNGFKLGFLGLLHMEVFSQRLDDEFDAQVMITAPSVPYKVKIHGEKNLKQYGAEELLITNATQMPTPQIIKTYYEPMVKGTIITPDQYLNSVTQLCLERRGEQVNSYYISDVGAGAGSSMMLCEYMLPLAEIIIDFNDHLKSISSGFASFDYEDAGFRETELVRLDFKLNDKPVDELSMIVHLKRARSYGRSICDKLAEHLDRQQFKIKIQALVGGKVVARSNLGAYRKDVTAKLYGGDNTRRMKLLARQAEGKQRMRMVGNIEISPEIFINVLKR